nr:multiple C2 and transmembrane domain-containing protein 1 [Salvelinus alpinus]
MLLKRAWRRSSKQQSVRLAELHRKHQLWRGIVSISLIEGRDLCPMDPNGLSDPYAKFRLGNQKYRSKTMPKTLCPQWREQFDLHMYEETGGVLEIAVWDKDTGRPGWTQIRTEHPSVELDVGGVPGLCGAAGPSDSILTRLIADLSPPARRPIERREIMGRYLQPNTDICHNVKDIHSVLEVTVFDEDRDRSADFLGKVAIPLLHIQNGEQKGYVLKNKEMTGPTKGLIYLESDVVYSTVKAGLRTIVPPEQKYIEEEPKVSKHLLQQNFNRVKRCIMFVINIGTFINSCFEWESPQRSISAFLFFVVVVWNFELYMVPGALLLLLTWNYFITAGRESGDTAGEATFEWEEEEEEKDDKDSERKGFMDKLYALQDVCVSVQSALDDVASYGERIKNTFNWTVPFLSWLAISVLCVATVLLYLVPLRYLVLAWGVNKFTKKLRNPYLIENNEVLDFLSRVPSDVQVMQYRELKFDPGQSPSKRKKTNLG